MFSQQSPKLQECTTEVMNEGRPAIDGPEH